MTAKKREPQFENPVDQFVYPPDVQVHGFGRVLRDYLSKPFDEKSFESELLSKLKRFHYPPLDHGKIRGRRLTFHDVLSNTETLKILLSRDTMLELWKLRALDDVFKRMTELNDQRLAADGISTREHRRKANHIYRDMMTLDRINKEYGLKIPPGYYIVMEEKRFDEIGSYLPLIDEDEKKAVLTGRPKPNPTKVNPQKVRQIRSEQMAVHVLIFRFLQSKLQTTKTKKEGVSDIFLCQLSELILAAPSVTRLTDGETLRKATKRIPR